MSLTLTFDELLRYTIDEREKWRLWLGAHPAAMELPLQPAGARHPTVGKLVDHIFLAQRRHLQRLREDPVLDESTGLTANNVQPMFDYGASVRRELEQYVETLDEDVGDQIRTFEVRDRQFQVTPRKFLFHLLLHEARHWAQIALALRLAGFDPPGDHDLFFSRALR